MGSEVNNVNDVHISELMSAPELKQYLHCNNNTLYSLLSRRDFPSFRIGKRHYIIKDELIKWMGNESKKSKIQ